MPQLTDYYGILGLPRTATQSDVKKRYRRLARRTHPDVNQGLKVAEELFKLVNEAYNVLSNPERRRQYDASLRVASEKSAPRIIDQKKKDLETIARTITAVAKSPVSYDDFFEAYGLWLRLDYDQGRFKSYSKGTPHTVAEIDEIERLKKRITKDLERFISLAERNYTTPEVLISLLNAYISADQIAQRYKINLRVEIDMRLLDYDKQIGMILYKSVL